MSAILVIDDKVKLCESLVDNFRELGYAAEYATSSKAAMDVLGRERIAVVLLDLALGAEDGTDVLEVIREKHPHVQVIMITGYATVEKAVRAIKLGAFDFVEKPLKFDKLLTVVTNAMKLAKLADENTSLRERIAQLGSGTISRNESVVELLEKARKLAGAEIPVLITGESGTGKELLAEFIHSNSKRSAQPMLKVNASAITESLLDSELFGHEKGAFTGADSQFIGVFERANGSTLLLDEIGDMALATQAKILRALQNQEIKRVGGEEIIKVDVRIIANTNRDLPELIAEKRFREDLYYRLNAAALRLPPLRERKEDVPLLAQHFLHEFTGNHGAEPIAFSPDVINAFLDHHWPGNIRELKNAVSYAAALATPPEIQLSDLPGSITNNSDGVAESLEIGSLDEIEKQAILKTLIKTDYNRTQAAELLNITRKTLYNKMMKYGLAKPE